MKYDVVVVGGGYGGLVVAQTAAKEGAKTLLLEKSKSIGERVPSTGAISIKVIKAFNIDKSVLANPLFGGKIYSPSGKSLTIDFGKESGFMTKKKQFFDLLAQRAKEKGAGILTSYRVKDVLEEKDWIKGVIVEHNRRNIKIESNVLIAADGMTLIGG
jgi:flavin-dependent dehydrogenase